MNNSRLLAFFFSSPLVVRDHQGHVYPVDSLDLDKERAHIIDALKEAQANIEFRSEIATAHRFRALTTMGYKILHFSGHGNPSHLAFEDEYGAAHFIGSSELLQLFEAGETQDVRFAFVSACHSRATAEEFVDAGIPHVVGVQLDKPINDLAAIFFSRAFYLALAAGRSVQASFDIARQAVANAPEFSAAKSESDKFLLLPEHADHSEVILEPISGTFKNLTPALPLVKLPAQPETVIGRNEDIQQVVEIVIRNRIVTLKGPPGIGKTTISISAGHYLHPRNKFQHGVFFVPLREATSEERVRFNISLVLGIEESSREELYAGIADKNILLILDNCEDALHNIPGDFHRFVRDLLQSCPNVHLLLTSRRSIGGGLVGATERLIEITRLDPIASAKLFISKLPRSIKISELGFPNGVDPIHALAEHELLKYLSGNPHAILLAAPLLETYQISQLTEMIHRQQIDALAVAGIPTAELDSVTSLVKSLALSVDHLQTANPEAYLLFSVIGLLPAGVTERDLEQIWGNNWRPQLNEILRSSLLQKIDEHGIHIFSPAPFIVEYAKKLLSNDLIDTFLPRVISRMAIFGKELWDAIGSKDASQALSKFAHLEHNFWEILTVTQDDKFAVDLEQISEVGVISYFLTNLLKWSNRIQEGIEAAEKGIEFCSKHGDIENEVNLRVSQAELYSQLAVSYDFVKAKFSKAISLSGQSGYVIGKINALKHLGTLKLFHSQIVDAREDFTFAIELASQNDLDLLKAQLELELGILESVAGNNQSASRFHLDNALEYFDNENELLHKAQCLKAIAEAQVKNGELKDALNFAEEARHLFQEISDPLDEANVSRLIGNIFYHKGDFHEAELAYEEARTIYEEISFAHGQVNVLRALGEMRVFQGKIQKGLDVLLSALDLSQSLRNSQNEAYILKAVGDAYLAQTSFTEAKSHFEAALTIFSEIGDDLGIANCHQSLGKLYIEKNEISSAYTSLVDALKIHRKLNNPIGMSADVGLLGRALIIENEFKKAMILFECGLRITRAIGDNHGEAVDLKYQAKLFECIEDSHSSIASLILSKAASHYHSDDVDNILNSIQQRIGRDQYDAIFEAIRGQEEEYRARSVNKIGADYSGDKFLLSIINTLPSIYRYESL